MDVAIIDYKMSNLYSVNAACEKVGLNTIITSDKNKILNAKVAILPGVGAFGESMKNIIDLKLDGVIYDFINSGKLFVGICLGLQLLFEESNEYGTNKGLGIIKGNVSKFKFINKDRIKYPVPQVGWNKIEKYNILWKNTLLNGLNSDNFMYFVHSYYAQPDDPNCILSFTKYGEKKYCSSIKYKNIFATQFHPEKSGSSGLKIYNNLARRIKECH